MAGTPFMAGSSFGLLIGRALNHAHEGGEPFPGDIALGDLAAKHGWRLAASAARARYPGEAFDLMAVLQWMRAGLLDPDR